MSLLDPWGIFARRRRVDRKTERAEAVMDREIDAWREMDRQLEDLARDLTEEGRRHGFRFRH